METMNDTDDNLILVAAVARTACASTVAILDYSPTHETIPGFQGEFLFSALAEKYGTSLSKDLSLQKFKTMVQDHWKSPYLADATREAYTSTIMEEYGMQEAITQVLYSHREQLDRDDIADLLLSNHQLTHDLLMRFHSAASPFRVSERRAVRAD